MAKRRVEKYDFKAFGEAIKEARKGRKESRKKVSDEMYISPRYLANIENNGQHPSLQIFFELIQLIVSKSTFVYSKVGMAFFSNLKISNCGQKGRIVVASRASVYTNAIFALQNACWDSPKPFVYCIRRMQAACFFKTLLFI